MTDAPLVLCDPAAESFWPLASTRPVADILAGTSTFHARWSRRFGPVTAIRTDEDVGGWAPLSGREIDVGRWPETNLGLRVAISTWTPAREWSFGDEDAEFRCEGQSVAWRVGPEAEARIDRDAGAETLSALGLPVVDVAGRKIDSLPELIASNGALIASDAEELESRDRVTGIDPITLIGDRLVVGEGVEIGPFVTIDTNPGPVVLDDGVRVDPLSVLRGPLYAGPGTRLLGGGIGNGSSFGPQCRVHGDVESSLFLGYSNKAHDGFVGHSAVGAWVNLGAGTTTSDLKNTYGPVRLRGPDGDVETGELKLGAMLGDHAKTGIGALLTTGARFGAGTHFFGGRSVSPPHLPEFSWADGESVEQVRLDAFLEAATRMMGRRERELGEGERRLLERLHARSASC